MVAWQRMQTAERLAPESQHSPHSDTLHSFQGLQLFLRKRHSLGIVIRNTDNLTHLPSHFPESVGQTKKKLTAFNHLFFFAETVPSAAASQTTGGFNCEAAAGITGRLTPWLAVSTTGRQTRACKQNRGCFLFCLVCGSVFKKCFPRE